MSVQREQAKFWIVQTTGVGERNVPTLVCYAVAATSEAKARRAVRQLNHDAHIESVVPITYPRAWRVTFER